MRVHQITSVILWDIFPTYQRMEMEILVQRIVMGNAMGFQNQEGEFTAYYTIDTTGVEEYSSFLWLDRVKVCNGIRQQPQGKRGRAEDEQRASMAQEACAVCDDGQKTNESEQESSNYERVKVYLAHHPEATDREIAAALIISSTANKWRKRIQAANRTE